MTKQSAIDKIKCFPNWNLDDEWLLEDEMQELSDMAVSALEKQIPKRIVIKNTKDKKLEKGIYVFYKCPECEEQIASGFYYPPHNEFLQENKFCKNCGQKLDWN